jgi:Xaa-Pro aminopeptidase
VYPHQRDRLRAVLSSEGLAALVTTAPLNIAWATSTSPVPGPAPRALVATPAGSVLIAHDEDPDADSSNADDVSRYGAGRLPTIGEALAATLAALEVGEHDPVALEIDPASAAEEPGLRAALGPREVRPGTAVWRRARAVKSPFELECLERGLVILEEALNAAIQVLAPGMTAQEALAICQKEAGRHGMTFDHALIAAVRGGRRRTFRAGDLLRLELSGFWKGYHAQVARAAVLGKPDADQEREHGALEAPLTAAIRTIVPGVRASAVHAAAAAVRRGIDVTGGGIGLEPSEPPVIGPDSDEPLEPGMVLTVAVAGQAGVRLVDTVLLTSRSFRRLNRSHAGLVILD